MTFHRWKFTDVDGVLDPWTFAMNPTSMDAPEVVETPVPGNRTTPGGKFIDIPSPSKGQQMTWSGVWRTFTEEAQFETFLNNARPVKVTDHYGRDIYVMLVSCDGTRAETHNWPQRQKFTAHVIVLWTDGP